MIENVQRTQPFAAHPPTVPEVMRAVVRSEFGGPDVLSVTTVPTPTPQPGEVLVRVGAVSLNPADLHLLRGQPFLMRASIGWRRPRSHGFGRDHAGQVVAVGPGVTDVAVGDRVVGTVRGACAEYVSAPTSSLTPVPTGLDLAEAAAVPIAGSTAHQALTEQVRLRPGQRVLVNGAAGGVGTFAVQLAADMGLEVTAVCSTRNVDMVASLGAHTVIDYTQTDWLDHRTRYDAIIDTVGSRPPRRCRRLLVEGGTHVLVGSPITHPWLDPLPRLLAGTLASLGRPERFAWFVAHCRPADVAPLLDRVAEGRLRPVIGRRVSIDAVPDAMRELATGHVRGKTVVEIGIGAAPDR